MANKFTEYFSKKAGKEFSNIDLLNAVREKASDAFKSDIPVLTKQLGHASVPTAEYEKHQNEFFDILINRIGTVVIKGLDFTDPFKAFKQDNFEFGDGYQEIYVAPAHSNQFDAKGNDSQFMFVDTEIHTFYHYLNFELRYDATIENNWTKKAFVSDNAFDNFIEKIVDSIQQGDEIDEFENVKTVLSSSLQEVQVNTPSGAQTLTIPSTKIDMAQSDWVIAFAKQLKTRSSMFKLPSRTRFENAAKVPNVTKLEDQYLIVSSDLESELDMLLANAFNMDKASVLARTIVVDEFPKFTGNGVNKGKTPKAFLIDKDALIFADKLNHMESVRDAKHLRYNVFKHHHYLLSYSLFENSHVFYTE